MPVICTNWLLAVLVLWLASLNCVLAPPPRCKVEGYYQAALLIFSCDGAGGTAATNQVQLTVPPRGTWTQTVPQATKNLVVTADSVNDISLSLRDPITLTAIQSSMYKKVAVNIMDMSGAQSHKKIQLLGRLPNDVILQVTNNAATPSLVMLGYAYGAFNSPDVSPQCRQGEQALGCAAYDPTAVRDLVSDWSCWIKDNFNSSGTAWNFLAKPVIGLDGLGVPVDAWCDVWNKWPDAARGNCMSAYKFLTNGGKEMGIQSVYRPNFEWAAKSCTLRQFFVLCCTRISNKWSSARAAWNEWTSSGVQSPGTGPWNTCKDLQPQGVAKTDFFKFLDADGFGGVRLPDIAVCWGNPSKVLPSSLVTASDVPSLISSLKKSVSLPYATKGRPAPTTTRSAPLPPGARVSNAFPVLPIAGMAGRPAPSNSAPISKPGSPAKLFGALPKLPQQAGLAAGTTASPMAYRQRESSILTGIAGGLAVATATAAGIAIQILKSKNKTRQPPPQAPQQTKAPQSWGSPFASPQTKASSVTPKMKAASAKSQLPPKPAKNTSLLGASNASLPASLQMNSTMLYIVLLIALLLSCLLLFLIWCCCRKEPKKRRGVKPTPGDQSNSDEELEDFSEDVPLLSESNRPPRIDSKEVYQQPAPQEQEPNQFYQQGPYQNPELVQYGAQPGQPGQSSWQLGPPGQTDQAGQPGQQGWQGQTDQPGQPGQQGWQDQQGQQGWQGQQGQPGQQGWQGQPGGQPGWPGQQGQGGYPGMGGMGAMSQQGSVQAPGGMPQQGY